MARSHSDVQRRILDTVERQLRRAGGVGVTLDAIAVETGCAKGLLNYHFTTKSELLAAAAERLLREREERWKSALNAPNPEIAIRQSWTLINVEVSSGFWRAWVAISSLEDKVTVRTVNNGAESFGRTLAVAVEELLRELGLSPNISAEEMGYLVGAAVQGFGMQLSNGMSAQAVEGAHDALWVGILSLTKPRRA